MYLHFESVFDSCRKNLFTCNWFFLKHFLEANEAIIVMEKHTDALLEDIYLDIHAKDPTRKFRLSKVNQMQMKITL